MVEMRRANLSDVPLLVDFMAEFYAEANYNLDRTRATEAFAAVLADDRLGLVWIIEAEHQDVGYAVLAFRYAMEYGGLIACLDDLFVRPDWRNQGLGAAALIELRSFCETEGIRAITVEAGDNNGPAQAVYRRAGFLQAANRQLLTLGLAAPAHVL